MDHDVLLERVKRWGGMTRKREAERAIFATLKALREVLFDDEADTLARELPPRLARTLRRGAPAAKFGAKEFYERASRFEGVAPRFAVEHAQAVCQALASLLAPLSVARLSRAAPELAALFIVPDRASHPATVPSPHAQTLSAGRPGSDHALSEAHPTRPGRPGSPSR
jgi:uncharacterized protein (DUF2267 family)